MYMQKKSWEGECFCHRHQRRFRPEGFRTQQRRLKSEGPGLFGALLPRTSSLFVQVSNPTALQCVPARQASHDESYTALLLSQWRRRMPCEHLGLPYHAVGAVGAGETETSLPCARLQSSGGTATLADNLSMCGRPVCFRSQPHRLRSREGVSRAAART
jgi:hypothetical protein